MADRVKRGLTVIIPALDEERALGRVLAELPDWVGEVLVADGGSSDATAAVAAAAGARVIDVGRRGYGAACQAGVRAAAAPALAFLDGDYSDFPQELAAVAGPVLNGEADLVIGSRRLGTGWHHVPPLARFGNRLSCALIRIFWGTRFTDLGPFRAVDAAALQALAVKDRGMGWPVEMQVKAAALGLRCREVPVSYRPRLGRSKISGTVLGSLRAGSKILWTILRLAAIESSAFVRRFFRRRHLIVFTRFPRPGRVKTRLIPELGEAGAAVFQRRMAEHIFGQARAAAWHRGWRLVLCLDGADEQEARRWLGQNFMLQEQQGETFGEHLGGALAAAFSSGARQAVLIGSDSPDLDGDLLTQAFSALDRYDLVLGPAHDGGYYLIGCRRHYPALFQEIPWSTPQVLAATEQAAVRLGLSSCRLKPLVDFDRPSDLTPELRGKFMK